MNKHDQTRMNRLVKLLSQAREQAAVAHMYLIANKRDDADIDAAGDALEHITIALEHLGAGKPEEAEKE